MLLKYLILIILINIITEKINNTKKTLVITQISYSKNVLTLKELLNIIEYYTAKSNKTLIIDTRNGGLGHSIIYTAYSICYALSLKRNIKCNIF